MTKKSQSKSSKKGLIIGISIGAAVAVAAAVTIPLLLLKKDKKTAYIFLDEASKELCDLSYKGQKGDRIDISDCVGQHEFTIEFSPKDTERPYSEENGFKIINYENFNTVLMYNQGFEKGTITITCKDPKGVIADKMKLEAKFIADLWTVTIDEDSRQYGHFGTAFDPLYSIPVADFVGESEAIISNFSPDSGYTKIKFDVTAEDESEGEFAVNYEEGAMSSFEITKTNGVFKNGDEVTLHLEEPTVYDVTSLESTNVTNSTIEFDKSSYAPGSLVTGTIVPDDGCFLPENASAIFFYADNEYNTPIFDISVTYDKSDEGEFSFIMPEQDVYVGAICHATTTCNILTKIVHENYPASIAGPYGQNVTITFINPEAGYHIAVDLDEFLSTHYVIGDYNDSSEVLSYTYETYVEEGEEKAKGTLKIQPLLSGYIIGGSAPAD